MSEKKLFCKAEVLEVRTGTHCWLQIKLARNGLINPPLRIGSGIDFRIVFTRRYESRRTEFQFFIPKNREFLVFRKDSHKKITLRAS